MSEGVITVAMLDVLRPALEAWLESRGLLMRRIPDPDMDPDTFIVIPDPERVSGAPDPVQAIEVGAVLDPEGRPSVLLQASGWWVTMRPQDARNVARMLRLAAREAERADGAQRG